MAVGKRKHVALSDESDYVPASDWTDKDVAGAYAPGVSMTVAGKPVKPGGLVDVVGGKRPKRPKGSRISR